MSIGAISKAQLALLYFPDQSKVNALQLFRRLIRRDISLHNLLKEASYFNSSQILTPKQVDIICEHIGRPSDFAYQRSFDVKRNFYKATR